MDIVRKLYDKEERAYQAVSWGKRSSQIVDYSWLWDQDCEAYVGTFWVNLDVNLVTKKYTIRQLIR